MFFNIYKQVNFGETKRVKSLKAEKQLDAIKVMYRMAARELLKNSFIKLTICKAGYPETISMDFSKNNYIVYTLKEIK